LQDDTSGSLSGRTHTGSQELSPDTIHLASACYSTRCFSGDSALVGEYFDIEIGRSLDLELWFGAPRIESIG
jgi:hypothetical protein